MDLLLAGERTRTLLVHDDERIECRFADSRGIDRLREGYGRRVFHGRYGHALGRIDVSPFAQDLLRSVEKRDYGQLAARFGAGARKCTAAEGRIRGFHAGDLRRTYLIQLDGKGIQVRGTCGLQFPVDADQVDLPGLLVAAAVDAYDHHDIVHVVVADPRPAILKAVGIRGTLDLDIFGFGFRIGSNGLPAAVADGLGDHDRLLGAHHGAAGEAALVDDIFRIGRIVVYDLHQPVELRPVIARTYALFADHDHGHELVGCGLAHDTHIAARLTGIILVHGEDRSGSGVQLRIAVEIDRPGIEPRTGCNIESGTFSGNFLGYGMAIHIERAAPAGFELIHRGHALLERNRLVGHVKSPVDINDTILAVRQFGVGVELQIIALYLAVVIKFRPVGDFHVIGLQFCGGTVVERTGIIDVECSLDDKFPFVDHGLAGKVGFPGGELTAFENENRGVGCVLLHVRTCFTDVYLAARKHCERRLANRNGGIERQFTRHVEDRRGVGAKGSVQADIARNLGSCRDIILRSGKRSPARPQVDLAGRRIPDDGPLGEITLGLRCEPRVVGHRTVGRGARHAGHPE